MKIQIPSRFSKIMRIAFFVLIAGATLVMSAAFLANYQLETNYFKIGAPLPIVAIMLATFALLAGTIDAFFTKNPNVYAKDTVRIAPVFPAIGYLVVAIQLATSIEQNLDMICAILAFLSALHCVMSIFQKAEYKMLTFAFGFASVIGCAMLTMKLYFDMTLEMNSPIKTLPQVALLCAMLFFTSELRCMIDRHAPRMYRFLTALTIASGSISSVPLILGHLIGRFDRVDVF